MGPRGESQANQPKRPSNLENSEDDEDGHDDGWRIGFDVEMRGVGIERTSSNTTGLY